LGVLAATEGTSRFSFTCHRLLAGYWIHLQEGKYMWKECACEHRHEGQGGCTVEIKGHSLCLFPYLLLIWINFMATWL